MYQNFRLQVAVVQEGEEPLTRCDLWGMQMSEGRLIKHWKTERYDRNMHMRWRRRDVAIANKFTEATFSLKGEDGSESVK